jgi:hypothetical protein
MKTLFVVLILSTMSGCTALLAVNSKLECLVPPPAAEGKFPFKITYANQGVRGIIEDTRTCKLEDSVCTGGVWKKYWQDGYASGKRRLIIPPWIDGRSYMVIPHGSCHELMEGSRPPNTLTVFLLEGSKETAIFDDANGVKPEVDLQYKEDYFP